VISADLAFQQASNTAAAIYAQAPAWLTYHTVVHVDVPSLNEHRDISRSVIVRTKDDMAVMQDLPRGAERVGKAFPLIPTFDALSSWKITYRVGAHQALDVYIENVQPLTYQTQADSGADVVVRTLRYYYPKYAPDSSDAPDGKTHILLKPLPTLTRNYSGDFFLSEVYIDNGTRLPSSVTYVGPENRLFVIDYGFIEGHWLMTHAVYSETVRYGPMHAMRAAFKAEVVCDNFGFPQSAPDPRLGP
jgi:hypothetical protein